MAFLGFVVFFQKVMKSRFFVDVKKFYRLRNANPRQEDSKVCAIKNSDNILAATRNSR